MQSLVHAVGDLGPLDLLDLLPGDMAEQVVPLAGELAGRHDVGEMYGSDEEDVRAVLVVVARRLLTVGEPVEPRHETRAVRVRDHGVDADPAGPEVAPEDLGHVERPVPFCAVRLRWARGGRT